MHADPESNTQDKPNEFEIREEEKVPEIKIYDYSDICSRDIVYSCVYNQYCRLPNNKENSVLSNVILLQ